MTLFWSIFLGIVQGLTEFLPVSSSGHLVIAQSLIPGFSQPGILFDVVLHFGTLFAVLYFFREKLSRLSLRYLILLFIGSLPAVFAGLFFRKEFEGMFMAINWVGFELILTGIVNLFVDRLFGKTDNITRKNSFLIGIAQAVAIIPGISRSGLTIFTGVKLGVTKEKAAEFSFLLSIPAIIGANILELFTHSYNTEVPWAIYSYGFVASLISGYFAIRLVYKFLSAKKFNLFGIYCIVIGIVAVVFL